MPKAISDRNVPPIMATVILRKRFTFWPKVRLGLTLSVVLVDMMISLPTLLDPSKSVGGLGRDDPRWLAVLDRRRWWQRRDAVYRPEPAPPRRQSVHRGRDQH